MDYPNFVLETQHRTYTQAISNMHLTFMRFKNMCSCITCLFYYSLSSLKFLSFFPLFFFHFHHYFLKSDKKAHKSALTHILQIILVFIWNEEPSHHTRKYTHGNKRYNGNKIALFYKLFDGSYLNFTNWCTMYTNNTNTNNTN